MKALNILRLFLITFSPTYLLILKIMNFCGSSAASWSIFTRKNSHQITHANHMIMTTSWQI